MPISGRLLLSAVVVVGCGVSSPGAGPPRGPKPLHALRAMESADLPCLREQRCVSCERRQRKTRGPGKADLLQLIAAAANLSTFPRPAQSRGPRGGRPNSTCSNPTPQSRGLRARPETLAAPPPPRGKAPAPRGIPLEASRASEELNTVLSAQGRSANLLGLFHAPAGAAGIAGECRESHLSAPDPKAGPPSPLTGCCSCCTQDDGATTTRPQRLTQPQQKTDHDRPPDKADKKKCRTDAE